MMSTLIAQAAASTATVAVQEFVESRRLRRKQTISALEIEISELQRRLGDFLPVEQAAKNRCNSEIERTHKELKQLYSLDVVDDMDEKAAAVQEEGYTALDWREFLSWTNEAGQPALAPFSISSPEFWIQFEIRSKAITTTTSIAESVKHCGIGSNFQARSALFADELTTQYHNQLYEYATPRTSYRRPSVLKATFSGVIPEEARKIITDSVESRRFDEVMLIAEVEDWDESLIDSDPLIVGRIGTHMFLLGQFDLTPTETAAIWAV